MKESLHENINPEDGWKDAEKLLDNHFRAKRKRRFIILLLLLLIGSVGIYSLMKNYDQKESTTYTVNVNTSDASKVEKKETIAGATSVNQSKEFNPVQNNESQPIVNTITSTKQNKNISRNQSKAADEKHENISTVALQTSDLSQPNHSNENIVEQSNVESNLQSTNDSFQQQKINEHVNDISFMTALNASFHINDTVNLLRSEIKTESIKKKSHLDILIYGGASFTEKNVKGNGNAEYLQRRNNEEQGIVLPVAGVQLSKGKNKFDIRAGLELSVLGEKVKYSPYSNGTYYNSYKEWQNQQYTYIDTDSTYIFGIIFLNTKEVTVNDSVLVDKTDTLNGKHYDASIQSANRNNYRYVLEVPIDVTYHINRNRFGVGICAGIAPGILFKSKGNYLRNDESGTVSLAEENKMQFALNLRAGLEFSYSLNERICLLFKPSSKFYVTGVKEKYGADNRYRNIGLNIGVMYNIK